MRLAQRLPEIWYGDPEPPWWLRALVPVYSALLGAHRWLYRRGWRQAQRLSAPVLVVGNITVGGTGKTPLVIALVAALRARGRRPGVVSRGYGGNYVGAHVLNADSTAAAVGDEPIVIAAVTGAEVAVGVDRVAAARLLLEQKGCDVIIADDGLQHRALARDVEICVIDGQRRVGNCLLLPAGPLREPTSRLTQVDFVVCNGEPAAPGEVPMQLLGDTAVALADEHRRRALQSFRGQRVHAVAGIGNPGRFFAMLRDAGLDIVEHAFPDHHDFRRSDLDFGDDDALLMTAKDAVKCRAFAQPQHWQVPVAAVLPATFLDAVCQRLLRAQ